MTPEAFVAAAHQIHATATGTLPAFRSRPGPRRLKRTDPPVVIVPIDGRPDAEVIADMLAGLEALNP